MSTQAEPSWNADEPDGVSLRSGSGMFSRAHDFNVFGGTYNNNNNIYVADPTASSDLIRMIPLEDIVLQRLLWVNKESGVIGRRRERTCVRRVYSATIKHADMNTDIMTVGLYEGDGAEEGWRQDIPVYTSVRHPSIVQIWRGARGAQGNMHAAIFHGDLVPLQQFLASYSPVMTVYLYACYWTEWEEVAHYLRSTLQRVMADWDCTMLIRNSTGQLSADLIPPDRSEQYTISLGNTSFGISLPSTFISSSLAAQEALAIDSLTPEQYHLICYFSLRRYQTRFIPASAAVTMGAVIQWSLHQQYEDHVEIATLAKLDISYSGWSLWKRKRVGKLMRNDWTCCKADEVFNTEIVFSVVSEDPQTWLSQANYIFSRLQITSNLEDYNLVDEVDFTILISSPTEIVPPGFLFLCPEEFFSWQGAFRQTRRGLIEWPERAAYWSLNSSGADPLSAEEVAALGFPAIQRITKSYGPSWPASVYTGLRQFHEAKGFDPESQDIARDLRKPLYQLSRETNPPFAHVEELSRAEEDGDEVDTNEEWEDAQSSLYDGHELGEESETENRQGGVKVPSEGHEKNAVEVPREPVDHEFPNDSLAGSFIRIIRGLRLGEGLDVEAETAETDPISPYLV